MSRLRGQIALGKERLELHVVEESHHVAIDTATRLQQTTDGSGVLLN